MSTSRIYKPVRRLVVSCTLLVTCLLFSGCEKLCSMLCPETQEAQHQEAQFPAAVLVTRSGDSAKGSLHRVVRDQTTGVESVEMDFNWNKLTFGGSHLKDLMKQKPTQFQLNVFEYETGKHIPSASMTDFEPIDRKDLPPLRGIPLDTLLRADLAFKIGPGRDAPEGEPLNFVVLFKKGKDLAKPQSSH